MIVVQCVVFYLIWTSFGYVMVHQCLRRGPRICSSTTCMLFLSSPSPCLEHRWTRVLLVKKNVISIRGSDKWQIWSLSCAVDITPKYLNVLPVASDADSFSQQPGRDQLLICRKELISMSRSWIMSLLWSDGLSKRVLKSGTLSCAVNIDCACQVSLMWSLCSRFQHCFVLQLMATEASVIHGRSV